MTCQDEEIRMRRTLMLLVSMAGAVVLASGIAIAAAPPDDGAQRTVAEARDAALDRALEDLVAMRGGRRA